VVGVVIDDLIKKEGLLEAEKESLALSAERRRAEEGSPCCCASSSTSHVKGINVKAPIRTALQGGARRCSSGEAGALATPQRGRLVG
jgi:hypothetical protein